MLGEPALRGDLNQDGKVNAADVKLLTGWLHGKLVTLLGDADLDGDAVVDVFDLGLLKRVVQDAKIS